MRKFDFISLAIVTWALTALSGTPTAAAHEGHKMECSETTLNGIKADIQSIGDGDVKRTASYEVTIAEEMMKKRDLEACIAHIHSAREAMEK